MRVAVVGHIEWVELLRVAPFPAPGDVVETSEIWRGPGGATVGVALQLQRLGCAVTMFTRIAEDALAEAALQLLDKEGIRVEATADPRPQRRVVGLVDEDGERTLLIVGEKVVPQGSDDLPWNELGAFDGACLISGDERAISCARQAPVLVASGRWLPRLRRARVMLDGLVGSARDPAERIDADDLVPAPGLLVATDGASGGRFRSAGGGWTPYEGLPADRIVDTYGCGDSFLGGITFGLARGESHAAVVAFAARCGTACAGGAGLSHQLRHAEAVA